MTPVEQVLADLEAVDPKWRVEIGEPPIANGWIRGVAFQCATSGPFNDLLERSAARLKTKDRLTVAALFSLRFGWAASVAIAPSLLKRCVPHVALSNISIKFKENTLFERTALHQPIGQFGDGDVLITSLRHELEHQSQPVVEALYEWSGFSRKGSWGMITSSWASHFVSICGRQTTQSDAVPLLEKFFEGDDEISRMKPRLNPVTHRGVTEIYQRRASCCRYYLLPQGDLCASCPLVSDEDRERRNIDWMEEQYQRRGPTTGRV